MTKKERNLIIGALRRVFGRSEVRRDLLRSVRVEEPKNKKDQTLAAKPLVSYICALCGAKAAGARNKTRPHINIDHIDPVVPVGKTYDDMTWDEIIARMFCAPERLQPICSDCHTKKTKEELRHRVAKRKERK